MPSHRFLSPSLCFFLSLAAASLLGPSIAWAQEQQEPQVSGPATPEIRRQLEKSVLMVNYSNTSWKVGLYPRDDASKSPTGSITAATYDKKTGKLISKGEYSPTSPVTIEPNEFLAITPVPEKSVGASLGLTKRADFDRRIFLKDSAGKKVDFRITRSGGGETDGKKPEVMYSEFSDLNAHQKKVFTLDVGRSNWLNILKPRLP